MANYWDELGGEPVRGDHMNTHGATMAQSVRDARNWNRGDLTVDSDDNYDLKIYKDTSDNTSVPTSWKKVGGTSVISSLNDFPLNPQEGDKVYVSGVGDYVFNGTSWQPLGTDSYSILMKTLRNV